MRISITRPLRSGLGLRLSWEYIDSDSNLPEADYRQNVLSLGLQLSL